MIRVEVTRRGAARIASGHPWVFRSDVAGTGEAAGGEAVVVVGPRGQVLGTAHYSGASQIALRMLSRKVAEPDLAFYRDRIGGALALRRRWYPDEEAYRVVHAEADFLPGLVVDRYGPAVAVQFLSQGMDSAGPLIRAALTDLLEPRLIVARHDAAVRDLEKLPREKRVLDGVSEGPVTVRMNGLLWRVDLLEGQKTGVYLDQRENYMAAARLARGAALDCFTSTGGFALHLARRCPSVEAVDSSAQALASAQANAEANGITNVRFREADVFTLLAAYGTARRSFDTVVLDPPGFAKSKGSVEAALRGYREINQRALRLLGPGGVLVTCSCSQAVSEAALIEVLGQAGADAGRPLRILERRTQGLDHPVLLGVPETLYLKCVIAQVCPLYKV